MIFRTADKERAFLYLNNIIEKDRPVKIEQVPLSKTISQNNYIWLVFTHIAVESGNTKNDIYEFSKKYCPLKEVNIAGTLKMVPITLSEMNKGQHSKFIDSVVIEFRQLGFDVPDPEDQKCLEMYQYYKEKGFI